MVTYVPDRTGRFAQRPHYKPAELDRECESIISKFLKELYGEAKYPVSTEDLTKLIERDAEDLDLYADLSEFGPAVEGMTIFEKGKRPRVLISEKLSSDERYENRLRTTLTHEYGHMHFHGYLWEFEPSHPDFFDNKRDADRQSCKRDTILDSAQTDWMEWQAGYACGALLMPVSALTALVRTYNEQHGLYGPVESGDAHGAALIEMTQQAFSVSADAARVRLTKLAMIGLAAAGTSLLSA